jgi:hypothetical protein
MPDDAAYQELVRVLEQAVSRRAYPPSASTTRVQAGPVGLGAGRIAEDMQQAVIEELVKRTGLARKSKGKFQVMLSGREFEVVVEEYDSFGESAFSLSLKSGKRNEPDGTKKERNGDCSQ